VDEGLLTVRAKIEENIGEESSNWKRREFFNSRFTRVFRLEKYGRGGEVKAAYEKGILSIEIPKMKEKARSIEIS
ncbi:MAG: Hsp20 family protein, partial [Saprospiraceae bacterium]|nr:Hsp20 family protein [Saprospiraceae bacterium]